MRAYEETVKYVHDYVQGGKKLIKHQATAIRLAEMATKICAVRSLLHEVRKRYCLIRPIQYGNTVR